MFHTIIVAMAKVVNKIEMCKNFGRILSEKMSREGGSEYF